MTFEPVHAANLYRITDFLQTLGEEGEARFRYFRKRPIEVVLRHRLCVVGLLNDRPVAYGHLDPEGETLWLGIAVDASMRGRGLGRQMMNYLIDHARSTGETSLMLTVDKGNPTAIRLYESMGFTPYDNRESYYQYRLLL